MGPPPGGRAPHKALLLDFGAALAPVKEAPVGAERGTGRGMCQEALA